MTDDILARLRAGSYLYNEETRNTEHIITKNERLAADEIVRLRGEVERLTLERDYWARARNEWEKSAGLLEEENKRLTRERGEARNTLNDLHERQMKLVSDRDAALARAEAAERETERLKRLLSNRLLHKEPLPDAYPDLAKVEDWLNGRGYTGEAGACHTAMGKIEHLAARAEVAEDRADAAEAKVAKLREALTFYARHTVYQTSTVYMSGARGKTEIECDAGERARAVLQETEQ